MMCSRIQAALFAFAAALPLAGQQTLHHSPLLARGYTVVPEPRKVSLATGDFTFGSGWRLELGPGIAADDIAAQSLREDLLARFHLSFSPRGSAGVVRLELRPGSVTPGEALDKDRGEIARQAYEMDLAPGSVRIRANAPQGLFYGTETLVQLLRRDSSAIRLPEGRILDWPDLQFRAIYWDDAHHLEHMNYLRKALRQAAFYKVNEFVIKLEGHFQFKSAPALVEPYALSPAELQELTDYGLRYHIELVPYLDGPAHIAFILKHPEYAGLREYPNNNYELCVTNPDSYKLLDGMFQDLLDANRGVHSFYLSTDEPYYVGLANNSQCREAVQAKDLGSVGKMLGKFTTRAGDYLHEHGRKVVFWGESPAKPDDIPAFPSYLINGETYRSAYDTAFKARGIREMVYVSTEGEERMFPQYYLLPADRTLRTARGGRARVEEAMHKIATDTARRDGDLMGAITAGWADAGLHTETFWLGYATIPSAAWNPSADPDESTAAFFPLFYGRGVVKMDRVYELMSQQAEFWADSWDTGPSTARKPILGSSRGVFETPQPAHDQFIALPPVPVGSDLSYHSTWAAENARRLQLADRSMADCDELLSLLDQNRKRAEFNAYSLEVFRSTAGLYRQNLQMLKALARLDGALVSAASRGQSGQAREAVAAVDRALDVSREIRIQRNTALAEAAATWYKTWYPRVAEANGRRFLHELDDIKDHVPDRTVDMSYLIYRELLLPFGEWYDKVEAARNGYARSHGLPERRDSLQWSDYTNTH